MTLAWCGAALALTPDFGSATWDVTSHHAQNILQND
jgi:hypothetical protein